MARIDYAYHELLYDIKSNGKWYEDPKRKGIQRLQIPRYIIEHDLTHSFPAITTKELYFKGVAGELIWFLRGDTSLEYLHDNNIHFWDKDGYRYAKSYHGFEGSMEEYLENVRIDPTLGDLGPIYGHQWRNFNGVDQLKIVLDKMNLMPMSTDLIVSSWNPEDLPDMALEPCHFMFQIIPEPLDDGGYGFTLEWSQRSVDVFLGLPFNIASYATLAHIIGHITGMKPLKLVGDLRNVHLYDNSIASVDKQCARSLTLNKDCQLEIDKDAIDLLMNKDIDVAFNKLAIDDFKLYGYTSHKALKVPMLERTI